LSREVRLSRAAAGQFRKLSAPDQAAVRKALERLAARTALERGGKSLKTIKGRHDRFFRLRVGDLRVMFDLVDGDLILVLGIVHRRDLERWLRGR
jgi:mRNA-degrading endonuclease RelE of RelBE toxin-antitoxin system